MSGFTCAICEKSIGEEQDSTTLVCNAAGQTVQHTSQVHDKCWEKFKKQFVRGRAGNRTANVFFCPVNGCHNSLHGQHTAVRQVEKHMERAYQGGDDEKGPDSSNGEGSHHRGLTEAERRKRDEALGLLEEVEDFTGRCQHVKADGSFCGRNIIDEDYQCCKIHLEQAKKKRALELALSQEDSDEKKRLEAQRREREEAASTLNKAPVARERGINMDIGEKARPAPTVASSPDASSSRDDGEGSGAPGADLPVAPVKMAAWAAAKSGLNQQKARELVGSMAYVDPAELEECPICLDAKAIIKLKPCGHAACDKCIDNWMMNSTSFATTIRTGKSVTTCPLCRATVQDTVALAASASAGEEEISAAEVRAAAELNRLRQQELLAQAEAMRNGKPVPPSGIYTKSVGPSVGRTAASVLVGSGAIGPPSGSKPRDLQPAFGAFSHLASDDSFEPFGGRSKRAERSSNTSDAGGA